MQAKLVKLHRSFRLTPRKGKYILTTKSLKTDMSSNKASVLRKKMPKHIRDVVWRKYNLPTLIGKCYACGEQVGYANFEIGHNKAITKRGSDKISNLRPVCSSCNKDIGNRGTIEAYRKRFFGSEEVKIPAEIIAKYNKTDIITSVSQVPLQLSSLEFEILLFLLDNKKAYTSRVLENAIQFSYIQNFLSDVSAILGNWIRYGRDKEERKMERKWYQGRENEMKEDWGEAKRTYKEYSPLLKKVLGMQHGRWENNTLRNFLFADNEGQNADEVIEEINKMGRGKVPSKKEIEGAVRTLQGLNYIYAIEQEGWAVAPYFYKLWNEERDKLVDDYERKKKDALIELKRLPGDDWELANQGAVIETAEEYMGIKYGDTTLDFYLLFYYILQ